MSVNTSFEHLRTTGDVNSQEKGSGARYDAGKTRYELIPTHLLKSTADVFAYGANKYAAWNWTKGMPWSKVIGCLKRHLAAIESGEDIDPESGLPHIGHLMCNALMLEHYRENYKTGDDRPSKWFTQKTDSESKPLDPMKWLEKTANNDVFWSPHKKLYVSANNEVLPNQHLCAQLPRLVDSKE